jgi:4-hydroxy-tetrahydrodipicolinate synthase
LGQRPVCFAIAAPFGRRGARALSRMRRLLGRRVGTATPEARRMQAPARIRGVVAAVATPVGEDGEPDYAALTGHSRWLLDNGCDGLNVLGTTGGFASFSVAQRIGVMGAIADAAIPLAATMVGTGTSSLRDTIDLTKAAVAMGFSGALVIPPFYYKGVSEDGIFAYYAALVEAVGASGLRLYLYNFPAMSGVAFTLPLVERLLAAYPGVVAGVKDSSNDAEYCAALHRAFPQLDVFPSSEAVLVTARSAGYAGCISATVNVTAPLAARVWSDGDDERQRELAAIRTAIGGVPLIPAVHHLVGELRRETVWSRLLPPLHALDEDQLAELDGLLARTSYRSEVGVGTGSGHPGG